MSQKACVTADHPDLPSSPYTGGVWGDARDTTPEKIGQIIGLPQAPVSGM